MQDGVRTVSLLANVTQDAIASYTAFMASQVGPAEAGIVSASLPRTLAATASSYLPFMYNVIGQGQAQNYTDELQSVDSLQIPYVVRYHLVICLCVYGNDDVVLAVQCCRWGRAAVC